MTQALPPTTDDAQIQQYELFDLGTPLTPPAPAAAPLTPPAPAAAPLPPLSEITPLPTARSGKRGQRRAAPAKVQPAQPAPVRLEIGPTPQPPAMPPLQLAAMRAALCQALAKQAQAAYQDLLSDQPNDEAQPTLNITTERIAAAARLLSDAPALNAAVTLLALGALEEQLQA